jgi:quercetin dioxygenase-like cupin family protein
VDSWHINSIDVRPRNPVVLQSDPEARVIAINLPAGEALHEHQVHERAYLFVTDGEVEVEQGGQTETGGPGYLAHFEAGEPREVRATSDARFVLLLAPWPGEGHPRQRAGGTGG